MKHLFLILTSALALSACTNTSSNVDGLRPLPTPPPTVIPPDQRVQQQSLKWITLDAGNTQFSFNPQVDVLFVIDNSDSMKEHETNLSRNINRFIEGFQANRVIDYHVGVTSVWDSSERFRTQKKDPYQNGELRFLQDGKGNTSKDARFVYRFQNAPAILAATLNIGVVPYDQGGPEDEELFSPVAAAIKLTGHGAANENFFRPNAQLIIVLVTDSDDSTSNLSPSQLSQMLIDFKGGDAKRVSVYGVLGKKSDPDSLKDYSLRVHPKYHPECFTNGKPSGKCDAGFGPDMIEQFIFAADAYEGTPDQIRKKYIMGINQPDFGQDLAQIGSDITVKTLAKEIQLPQAPMQVGDPKSPDYGRIMVRVIYGTPEQIAAGHGQEIPQADKGGWLYEPSTMTIQLSGDIHYKYSPGASFVVMMAPAQQN